MDFGHITVNYIFYLDYEEDQRSQACPETLDSGKEKQITKILI